jgi:tRNA (cmo5U34)-methyltransferase
MLLIHYFGQEKFIWFFTLGVKMKNNVKEAFDRSAEVYDKARRQLIPCFDEYYGTALALIPFGQDDKFSVLDLGAGTGLLSAFIHDRFPNAHITLADISDKMLSKARARFERSPEMFDYKIADYTAGINGSYDCIVSALSIHHLTSAEKQKLFCDIYSALPQGGMFINADQALGALPEIEKIYRSNWLGQVKCSGLSEQDIASALERLKEDKMDTLESQLAWMKQSGFRLVNCWYQNYSFMVVSGTR